jgi:acetoacetyl-CoA synthetase
MSDKSPILWRPVGETIAKSQLHRFAKKYDLPLNFAEIHAVSIANPHRFWTACHEFLGIKLRSNWSEVFRFQKNSPSPRAEWFPGATLNFAENLLAKLPSSEKLLTFRGEDQVSRSVSTSKVIKNVRHLAGTLVNYGVGAGVRCAAIATNSPETVQAMLACTTLGGIWSSCSPDFGVTGVLDRLEQLQPTVLFVSPGYYWKGAWVDCTEKIRAIASNLPSVKAIISLPFSEDSREQRVGGVGCVSLSWDDALTGEAFNEFVAVPFDAPLYVMFSSGTTGKPKCIVHSVGGTLLEHLKELVLHTDIRPGDRMLYHTTCGWMMWNWMVSALGAGASLVLYDGSPLERSGRILFDIVSEEAVTCFGTSAKFIALAEKAGVKCDPANLGALRSILSTGSPLLPESFDYIYRDIHPNICLSSIAGGTDIIGCFTLGNPWTPVTRGETQGLSLGLDVQVWNGAGQRVRGEKGELVCAGQFPSMPIGFFGDDERHTKFRNAYFAKFPGVWHHGDYVAESESGGLIYYGRSDAVLNPGGVRIGTAEIYRQVERLEEITESVVIGQNFEGDVRVVLFVKLRDGLTLTDELRKKIVKVIRENASPFHVPRIIEQVTDIPRTRSGKIAELAVRDVVEGRAVNNTEALANPEALEQFKARF